MTDSNREPENQEFDLDAQIRDYEEARAWNAVLWKWLGEVVSFVPTYRDTRQGRKTRQQMRAVILVVGLVLMAVGGQADSLPALWILLGVAIASSVFVIPVEEMKKRSWRGKIKKKQRPRKKAKWRTGKVRMAEGRVEVHVDGKRKRRVRVDRDKHDLVLRRRSDWTCVGVLPPGAKKSDNIWICTDENVVTDDEIEQSVADSDIEYPAKISGADWEKMWQALNPVG